MNAFLWRTAILLVVPSKIPVEEKAQETHDGQICVSTRFFFILVLRVFDAAGTTELRFDVPCLPRASPTAN